MVASNMNAIDIAYSSGQFHRLGWGAMFGMVYTVLQDDRTEVELLRYLQTVAANNGLRPAFVVNALSKAEARQSMFHYSRILLKNLDGDMIDQVADGTLRLEESDDGRAVLSALRESGGKEFNVFDRQFPNAQLDAGMNA